MPDIPHGMKPYAYALKMRRELRMRLEGEDNSPIPDHVTVGPVPEVVYLIGSPDGGLVKIGRTCNVNRRLADIQRMSPVPLALLWHTPGNHILEKALHRAFSIHRTHGEWFDFGDDDPVAMIERRVSP